MLPKKKYYFGGIKVFKLEEIESEVINKPVYLDAFSGSDERFKFSIQEIENVLDLLLKLKPKQFKYNRDKFVNLPDGIHFGYIAQELREVFPEIVKEDNDGFLYLNYQSLPALLTQGIKEMDDKINRQDEKISQLEKSLNLLMKSDNTSNLSRSESRECY